MKKVIRLTESELVRLVKRTIQEMENQNNGSVGGTVKSLAKRDMTPTEKKDWVGLYELTQNDNTNFEILTVKGSPSVGGVSKNLKGKYLKPTDYIKVPNSGDEVYFIMKVVS
jgi:hypothetical protein